MSEAESLLDKALAIDRKTGDGDQTALSRDLRILGEIYIDQRKYDRAEPLLQRALAIDAKRTDNFSSSDLRDLAKISMLRGNNSKAEDLANFGPTHRFVDRDLYGLAELCRDQGKNAEADEIFAQANELTRK